MAPAPPVVLTVAGSDNSCGAGLQADLKTITALGGYALTAATCVVAEVPGRVSRIAPVPPAVVAEQIRLAFEAFPVAAVKTGMLYSAPIIRAVAAALVEATARRPRSKRPALVVDPVMVASSGDPLLRPDAVAAYRRLLLPAATVVTPNTDELAVLAGEPVRSFDDLERLGHSLARRYQVAFLLKGGHLRGPFATDLLVAPDGRAETFSAPFVKAADPHGTGCTYSAAIAARLAAGDSLTAAVAAAKSLITRAIVSRHRWGKTEALNPTPPPDPR